MGLLDLLSGGEYGDAAGNQQKALEKALALKNVQLGKYTPTAETAVTQGPSAYDNIALDPQTRQPQLDALRQLQTIGTEGGLTAGDKAALGDVIATENTNARGQREAILDNARARGVGGSGLEMLGQLTADQNAATNAASQGRGVAQMAQQRALQALQATGQLGHAVRGQDYGIASDDARAKDQIANWNASNSQGVQERNTSNTNQANYANNISVPQQQFQDDLGLGQYQSGAYNARAGQQIASGNQTLGLVGGLLNTAGTIAGAAAGGLPGAAIGGQTGKAVTPPPQEVSMNYALRKSALRKAQGAP